MTFSSSLSASSSYRMKLYVIYRFSINICILFVVITTISSTTNALVSPLVKTSSNLKTTTNTGNINKINSKLSFDPTFIRPDLIKAGITEELCIDTANRMERILVPVSELIHPDQQVGISYSYWPAATTKINNKKGLPPVILVHGFDSSCLEFRRLGLQLAERGIDTYAVDLLGWGYTQLDNVKSFSAVAKVDALESFINIIMKNNKNYKSYCIVGASLGGAASMEIAVRSSTSNNNNQKQCSSLILIDAQGFVDGIGPMSSLPTPLAKIGINVLKSIPLRSSANQMSYYNKKEYATEEAVLVGRYHIIQQSDTLWSNALLSFMKSGGFKPTQYIPKINENNIPTLILWGRQDNILDGKEFTSKFLSSISNSKLQWIEECGHVPHLEQPMYVYFYFIVYSFLSFFVLGCVCYKNIYIKQCLNPCRSHIIYFFIWQSFFLF